VSSVEIKPERFGRYLLLDRIGVGGMAEVVRVLVVRASALSSLGTTTVQAGSLRTLSR
jgi:hypothetical protein